MANPQDRLLKFCKEMHPVPETWKLDTLVVKEIHSMVSPGSFSIWGMDILGPFPTTPGQKKFLLVVVDYFTKWVEAELLANITISTV